VKSSADFLPQTWWCMVLHRGDGGRDHRRVRVADAAEVCNRLLKITLMEVTMHCVNQLHYLFHPDVASHIALGSTCSLSVTKPLFNSPD
jgi:hypothetical protein